MANSERRQTKEGSAGGRGKDSSRAARSSHSRDSVPHLTFISRSRRVRQQVSAEGKRALGGGRGVQSHQHAPAPPMCKARSQTSGTGIQDDSESEAGLGAEGNDLGAAER